MSSASVSPEGSPRRLAEVGYRLVVMPMATEDTVAKGEATTEAEAEAGEDEGVELSPNPDEVKEAVAVA